MTSILGDTIGAICGPDEYVTIVAGPPGDEPGWVNLAGSASRSIFDEWFAVSLAGIPNGARDVAGSYLASFLADVIGAPVARALLTCDRGILVDAETTWVRQHADGWFDGVAFDADVAVLDSDPRRGDDRATPAADRDDLRLTTIDRLAAVLAPLFAAVRARAPYGQRGMWGALADSIASDATWRAHETQDDVVAAWDRAQPLVDLVEHAAPVSVTRPTLARIEHDRHVAHLSIRGTCCLYYKSVERTTDHPIEYCTSCPLGSDDERRLRQEAWLQRDIAGRA